VWASIHEDTLGASGCKPQAYFTSEENGGGGYFYNPASLPLGTDITARIGKRLSGLQNRSKKGRKGGGGERKGILLLAAVNPLSSNP
jgi:hypothetical protein